MMGELLNEGGRSIKRLIPLVAFIVLIIVLVAAFFPYWNLSDNQTEIILNVIEVMGWTIASGFGFTTVEKFSRRPGRMRDHRKDRDEEEPS